MTIESLKGIKVALVHDWLNGMRGGEKCLEVLCEMFPDADLYTLIHDNGKLSKVIESMKIRTSFSLSLIWESGPMIIIRRPCIQTATAKMFSVFCVSGTSLPLISEGKAEEDLELDSAPSFTT